MAPSTSPSTTPSPSCLTLFSRRFNILRTRNVGILGGDAFSGARVFRFKVLELFLQLSNSDSYAVVLAISVLVGVAIPSSAISIVFSASDFENFSKQARRSGVLPYVTVSVKLRTSREVLGVLMGGGWGCVSSSGPAPGRLRRVCALGVAGAGGVAEAGGVNEVVGIVGAFGKKR